MIGKRGRRRRFGECCTAVQVSNVLPGAPVVVHNRDRQVVKCYT